MKNSKLMKILSLSILLLTTWCVSQELRSNVEKELLTIQEAQLNKIGKAEGIHTLPTEIRIGGAFPIVSRPDVGRDRRDAFLMAINEINNQTGTDRILPEGINLVPKVVDNPEVGDQAAAQELILWGADIVIGPSRSAATETMASELTPHRIPVISATATASTLSNRTLYPYFLRLLPSTKDNARAIADFVKLTNWTKGATIHSDDLFSSDSIQDFIEIFENNNGTILTDQSFTTGDTNVSAQILAIKNAAPDFVMGTFVDPVNAVTLEIKAQGIENYTWIGGPLTEKAIGLDSVKGPIFDLFNSSWFDPAWNWLEGPAHSQSTGSAFDYPGGDLTPYVYDAVYVAAKGLASAGTTEGIDLTEALYEVKFEGASQIVEFNDIGEMWGRFNYVQFENNVSSTFGEWFGTPYIETTLTLADGTILTFDTIAPNLSIDSPFAHTYQTDTITVTLSGDAVHYWYFIEAVDSQNHTWTTSANRTLPDGIYVLHAYGNDSTGNIAHALLAFTIDTSVSST
ncbi:MAG: ABC transporter substrate-binding protein, partial [Candidatus Hodarchaeales archaeon]